jgi:3'(2'), 5'-bisphosphate nucleotidase
MDRQFERHLLQGILHIAEQAGKEILEVYKKDFAVESKADQSPVTEADINSERVILAGLRQLTPGTPVVAEESVASGRIPDVSKGEFWLVDPLDGTKEFIKKNGEFTVNIALVRHGVPVLGVVYSPALLDFYWAESGSAWKKHGKDTPERIRARKPAGGLLAVGSRSHRTGDLEDYLSQLNIASEISMGSSLKFCLVASGAADLYPRFGTTMEWDTAAGHAVVLASGGRVILFDGSPLFYGKPGFKNPNFLVTGRGDINLPHAKS